MHYTILYDVVVIHHPSFIIIIIIIVIIVRSQCAVALLRGRWRSQISTV